LERESLKRLGDPERYVLLDPRIDALLDGRIQYGLFPQWATERLIAEFSAGWRVRVSRKKTKLKPDVERLEGYDEIWALCVRARAGPPGWRILGRFYEKNVFIGLRAWDKRHLFSHYPQAAQEVIDDWKGLFGAQAPLRSQQDDLNEYLSKWEDIDATI
jgi:hypothetical protein